MGKVFEEVRGDAFGACLGDVWDCSGRSLGSCWEVFEVKRTD